MAYDEQLAERVRRALADRPGVREQRMFGGLAFLVGGHMACGVVKGELMLRVGADAAVEALRRPHARPMDFTGRPLKGFVFVAPEGVKTEEALRGWIDEAVAFVSTLPPKTQAS